MLGAPACAPLTELKPVSVKWKSQELQTPTFLYIGQNSRETALK